MAKENEGVRDKSYREILTWSDPWKVNGKLERKIYLRLSVRTICDYAAGMVQNII